ncbi:MAG: glycosyltransferase [Chloroflexi bacterium]|nr:glycosyltransferase [Chloroflexota bacterium]
MPKHFPGRPGIGWFRATIPGRTLPAPKTRRRTWTIRAIAATALAVTLGYLVWRAGWTLALDVWWLSIPLLVLEIHAFIGLLLFTVSLWDVDRRPTTHDVTETDRKVAVLVPTYNEGLEVLMPTVAAAVAMRVPHETWVLDDGNRPEVAKLAAELGAKYIARPTHEHAKAGNLNHALGIIDADYIGVLDADHVASPDFLVRTLGYFDDSRIALVQTPQEFYNLESFEHESGGTTRAMVDGETDQSGRFHEQALFYRILQPGKNRWGGAFWCGTGAVLRVNALRDVGLVATDTITEDIHTTIRLHRRGWKTIYHNEILARGLAAPDAATYQLQRHRWGTGAMQVLRKENPITVSGLTLGQRLTYAATLSGWFDAWRTMGYLVLPMIVVATGVVPIAVDALTFAIAFVTMFILSQISMRVLSRGCHRPALSLVFELVRMTPNLLATTTLLSRQRATFKVTPKGRTSDGRTATHVPRPLTVLLGLSVIAVGWYALTLLGVTPVTYSVPWAVHAAFGWMLVNVAFVWLAIQRVRSPRFTAERRSSVRFATDLLGRIDGIEVIIKDVSLTGARVELPLPVPIAEHTTLTVDVPDGPTLEFIGENRLTWTDARGRPMLGFEFDPGQHASRARLALALFGADDPDLPILHVPARKVAKRSIKVAPATTVATAKPAAASRPAASGKRPAATSTPPVERRQRDRLRGPVVTTEDVAPTTQIESGDASAA